MLRIVTSTWDIYYVFAILRCHLHICVHDFRYQGESSGSERGDIDGEHLPSPVSCARGPEHSPASMEIPSFVPSLNCRPYHQALCTVPIKRRIRRRQSTKEEHAELPCRWMGLDGDDELSDDDH
ncbi:hypothetical protein Tco_1329152 [Tanacetum coccineum]